jgi:hypothetical protein
MSAADSVKRQALCHLSVVSMAFGLGAICACAGDGEPEGATPEPDAGTEPDGGQDSGMPRTPAHERVGCDLPLVIEFCGGATCHYSDVAVEVGSSLAMWDRQSNRLVDDIHARLVGVEATYRNVPDPENCPLESELLVDPSNVEQSLILKKLEARHTCGVEMPKFPYPEWGTVANPGPQREMFVSCIREWVALLVEDYNQAP